MNLDAIRESLRSIPEIEEVSLEEASEREDALAVATDFTKMLRKLGVQQMRDSRDLLSSLEEPLKQTSELHEALQRERRRASEAERQLEGLVKNLIQALDLLDRMRASFARVEGMDAWSEQVAEGIDVCLKEAEKNGLVTLGKRGEPFDESVHDIHGRIPKRRGNLVVGGVAGRGYALNGKVMRRAQVAVETIETLR